MKIRASLDRIALAVALSGAGLAQAAPTQYAVNGHWYEYIPRSATWDEAAAAAAGMSFNGMNGYLATVTDAGEQAFIHGSITADTAWLGANDRAVEGEWRWATGPEAGTLFYQAGSGTVTYSFWAGGEPNNCCNGEDDLVINWGGDGSWNDIGLPSFPDYRLGFIVEYSSNGVPEPQTYGLMALGLAGVALGSRRRRPR